MLRRDFLLAGMAALIVPSAPASPAQRLVAAASTQLGVTTSYDPAYVRLAYPGGDVPRATGVCADVVVRAYRDALALDLQKLVHEDMSSSFAAYPRIPGMRRPDTNIDHRRVVNLEVFWRRSGAELWRAKNAVHGDAFPAALHAGDLLTWRLNAGLPHVGLVSEIASGGRITVLHNVGRGVEEIPLVAFAPYRAARHYRWQV